MGSEFNHVWPYCIKSTQYSIHSRRCFMTGEFCSKQANVHREREKLHKNGEINAFVVMNFSDMSDVVYKWKLQSFVESLKRYLFLDRENHRIACVAHDENELPDPESWTKVEKINVVRADSNTETNYVICNRVCQQMQIADLIIVDVSVENTNVFYEFGMAAAFQKLILPICYNESFYEMKLPAKAERMLEDLRNGKKVPFAEWIRKLDEKNERKEGETPPEQMPEEENYRTMESFRKLAEHHIDSYPWRRRLFEFYGIRYRNVDSHVGYSLFAHATDPRMGFTDERFNRFPYDAQIECEVKAKLGKYSDKDDRRDGDEKKVGYHVYNLLRNSYNETIAQGQCDAAQRNQKPKSKFNTLVVYTMDDVLNEEQAGQCIINYYRNMTAQIRKERCFCGDRVGILGQGNAIPDDPKDSKTDKQLLYRVSEIIRIGMNQATYVAQQRKIKTEEFLNVSGMIPQNELETLKDKGWAEETIRFTKEHIRNRCIPIYPDEPIYVKQLLDGIQKDVLNQEKLKEKMDKVEKGFVLDTMGFDYEHFFNLFHVMLFTLRYTNQIVVDLSRNSLQALFWLGMAHGSDVHAITVRHIPTQEELARSGAQQPGNERSIFDVAGLWTAILRSNDTESFYRQLAMTQMGIEQHSKLTLADQEMYHERMQDQLYTPSPFLRQGSENIQKRLNELNNDTPRKDLLDLLGLIRENDRVEELRKTLADKNREESKRLESFYRDRFWRRMLRYNDLRLYMPRKHGETDHQPRLVNITWDVDSLAELSHYLSKRKIIGSYRQYSLIEGTAHKDAHKANFISIGGDTMPLLEEEKWKKAEEKSEDKSEEKAEKRNGEKSEKGISLVSYVQGKTGNAVREMRIYEHDCERGKPAQQENAEQTEKPALQMNMEQQGTNAEQKSNEIKHCVSFRGFFRKPNPNKPEDQKVREENVFTQFVTAGCISCGGRYCEEANPANCKPLEGVECGADVANRIYFGACDFLTEPVADQNPRKMELDPKVICKNEKQERRDNKKDLTHDQLQLGQMLLWREVSTEEDEDAKFWVSLEGISGPATIALTTLLVDEEQKKERLDGKEAEEPKRLRIPLNKLQKRVRSIFMEKYLKKLDSRFGDNLRLKTQAKYAAALYLSTVLYQYFLPFLSKADERRICNGMHAYLCAMQAADGNNFKELIEAKVEEVPPLKIVEEVLQDTIRELRGVEALYVTEVSSKDAERDSREPREIRTLPDRQNSEGELVRMVSGLFLEP